MDGTNKLFQEPVKELNEISDYLKSKTDKHLPIFMWLNTRRHRPSSSGRGGLPITWWRFRSSSSRWDVFPRVRRFGCNFHWAQVCFLWKQQKWSPGSLGERWERLQNWLNQRNQSSDWPENFSRFSTIAVAPNRINRAIFQVFFMSYCGPDSSHLIACHASAFVSVSLWIHLTGTTGLELPPRWLTFG